MKTAISVPDDIFVRAERAAKKHGLNRSQFYAAAAERYATELETADRTAEINDVVDELNDDGSARFAVAASAQTFDDRDAEW